MVGPEYVNVLCFAAGLDWLHDDGHTYVDKTPLCGASDLEFVLVPHMLVSCVAGPYIITDR